MFMELKAVYFRSRRARGAKKKRSLSISIRKINYGAVYEKKIIQICCLGNCVMKCLIYIDKSAQ